MSNHTLAIIKPDSVSKSNTGKIIDRILNGGFQILAMQQVMLTRERAEAFYAVHRERPFFNNLVEFMTSGSCVPMALKKEGAVTSFRKLIGATNPEEADEGTIRRDFAENIQNNAVHGSDSNENAVKEIAFFFSSLEISTD
ncbi:MAG TPA: nucleoside-diphosphate kinase [Candidatus Marinimicrobia bacterium]|nr:nucleoside-diphosphate kinase [Candidatus Neomarinimicrobiota bacterium]HIA00222.1 nucleoside-diphosphate kinase [Candidatus Neomarinimicrobiota bacterium]HIB03562.1 nucleoside-diphosphate kinase [Candidatus Neomarinimicrobiota bacterium]HIB72130.1 nucleoside-diphosphate kinase [Candidatus Neomarinimicrobiota bacterium]HIB95607.1 nucleoside-diphosphate kinase [Candidatus Neomarinimicrobiota bacterium]